MPKEQIHKRFSNDQVKTILNKYTEGDLKAREAVAYLGIGKVRFYQLAEEYQDNPEEFTIAHKRNTPNNRVDPSTESNILKELKIEKIKIIDNPNVPTNKYNYSYIRDLLKKKYNQEVSLPTIINRAKKEGYWKKKPPKKKHEREVITNYAGELAQHDSSFHLWAPDAREKWYAITTLDDYSRKILYGDLFKGETSWAHISAVKQVVLKYGIPLSYYADQHRIFRYVKDRDKHSVWVTYTKFTDDIDPQWKKVLKDCQIKSIYALSPQAKGKIERPYEWMQDHVVRTCVRENVKSFEQGREIFRKEIDDYNRKRVHSTTGEIPDIRFRNAIKEGKTLFRPFEVKPPLESVKDIFCLRMERVVDAYRKISLGNFEMKVPKVEPRHRVELRLYPDIETGITEVRFWWNNRFVGFQRVKNEDLPIVHL